MLGVFSIEVKIQPNVRFLNVKTGKKQSIHWVGLHFTESTEHITCQIDSFNL